MHKIHILFLIFLLCSCGGSGDVDVDNVNIADKPEDSYELKYYKGNVADGYLVGAKVCLDLNLSGSCDPEEPMSISSSGGTYSFYADPNDIAPILAEINPSTVDEDTGMVVGSSYSLIAPSGYDFISPITTLIYIQSISGKFLTESEEIVTEQLGLGSNFLPYIDYIDAKSDSSYNQDVYRSAHNISKAIASIFTLLYESYQNHNSESQNLSSIDLLKQNLDFFLAMLPEISASLEGVLVQNDYFYQNDCIPGFRLRGDPLLVLSLGESYDSYNGFIGVSMQEEMLPGDCAKEFTYQNYIPDTSTAGIKTINYSITDDFGNQSSLSQKIIVIDTNEFNVIEPDSVESDPVELDSVESDPVESDPVESDPVESDPVESDPVESDPVESDPVESDPVESDPVESDPVESDPVESDPDEPEHGNNELLWDYGNWNTNVWAD